MRLSRPALIVVTGALLLPAGAEARVGFFRSPSDNIGCYISSAAVRCDIAEHTWKAPARPKWCDVDWGSGLAVGRKGIATFVCAGDTALHQGRVLAYGARRSEGRFTCTSRVSGMRCVNRRNGHGFVLARHRYRRF